MKAIRSKEDPTGIVLNDEEIVEGEEDEEENKDVHIPDAVRVSDSKDVPTNGLVMIGKVRSRTFCSNNQQIDFQMVPLENMKQRNVTVMLVSPGDGDFVEIFKAGFEKLAIGSLSGDLYTNG